MENFEIPVIDEQEILYTSKKKIPTISPVKHLKSSFAENPIAPLPKDVMHQTVLDLES